MNERNLKLAKQVGIEFSHAFGDCYTGNVQLDAFAELVRQDERDAIANFTEKQRMNTKVQDNDPAFNDFFDSYAGNFGWVQEGDREALLNAINTNNWGEVKSTLVAAYGMWLDACILNYDRI